MQGDRNDRIETLSRIVSLVSPEQETGQRFCQTAPTAEFVRMSNAFHNFAIMHNGTASVESRLGHGTIVAESRPMNLCCRMPAGPAKGAAQVDQAMPAFRADRVGFLRAIGAAARTNRRIKQVQYRPTDRGNAVPYHCGQLLSSFGMLEAAIRMAGPRSSMETTDNGLIRLPFW